jgi:hypothetical protein
VKNVSGVESCLNIQDKTFLNHLAHAANARFGVHDSFYPWRGNASLSVHHIEQPVFILDRAMLENIKPGVYHIHLDSYKKPGCF